MFTIRSKQPGDDAALAQLYYRIRRGEFPWEKEIALGDYYRHTKGEEILVAESEGAIAGFCSVWKLGKFVHCLYVHQGMRRRGVGAALLEEAKRRYGVPLTLRCMKENRSALHFYKAMGFAVTDTVLLDKGECLELTWGGSGMESGFPDDDT